ncbi:MAG: chloride channel protein, partial [Hylemonella sp.]
MNREPDFFEGLQSELSNGRRWLDRVIVLAYAAIAGLLVVGFTLLSEFAFDLFQHVYARLPWMALIWTPACTVLAVWCTRRYFSGAAGSGIPQVLVALSPEANSQNTRERFVSLRLTFGKIGLASLGLLGGLSLGREG